MYDNLHKQEFREKHSITLYGKGRKQYKPLFSFEELGFPKSVMKICAKFDKPTPIQVLQLYCNSIITSRCTCVEPAVVFRWSSKF